MQFWQLMKKNKNKKPAFILLTTLSFFILLGSIQIWQIHIYEKQMVIYIKVIKSYQAQIKANHKIIVNKKITKIKSP